MLRYGPETKIMTTTITRKTITNASITNKAITNTTITNKAINKLQTFMTQCGGGRLDFAPGRQNSEWQQMSKSGFVGVSGKWITTVCGSCDR